jgi:poly(ADP-ribose) glycohydrolase ARH3
MTTQTKPPAMLDRFRGCLLGLAVGDAVGSPFEAIDGYGIYKAFGPPAGIVRDPPVELLEYTDDTEMMIGVAETLAGVGRIDEETLAAAFARNFDVRRGYGGGAKQILAAMRDGRNWRRLAGELFPDGSYGNGAGMRVAPVGIFFHRDLDRVDREAEASAVPTHRHPLGVDGARTIALAVAMAAQPDAFGREAFFAELYARAATAEFRDKLVRAATADASFVPGMLGDGVAALDSVVTAVAVYDENRDSYAGTLAGALGVGGDVDTIAAMAGAITGARLGAAAIPSHLLARLENGVRGRDAIDALAHRLHDRWSGANNGNDPAPTN